MYILEFLFFFYFGEGLRTRASLWYPRLRKINIEQF